MNTQEEIQYLTEMLYSLMFEGHGSKRAFQLHYALVCGAASPEIIQEAVELLESVVPDA